MVLEKLINIHQTKKFQIFLCHIHLHGCSASCLYCYLVCHFNKCSYLRLFVNREQMLDKIIKTANSSSNTKELTFEIGSNSDLILENPDITTDEMIEALSDDVSKTLNGCVSNTIEEHEKQFIKQKVPNNAHTVRQIRKLNFRLSEKFNIHPQKSHI